MANYLKPGIFCLLVSLFVQSISAQVLLSENFTSGSLPAAWTNTGLPNNQFWAFDNPGQRQVYGVGFDASFAMLDSDHFGGGQTQDAYLTTPALDASGLANVWLVFSESFRSYPNSFHEVLVSSDDGASWVTLRKDSVNLGYPNPVVQTAIDLSPVALGSANLKVAFRFRGKYAWWWALDSVRIGSFDAVADYPQVNVSRPRILISGERFEWLKNNYTLAPCNAYFNQFQAGYNASWVNDPLYYMAGSDSTLWDFTFPTAGSQWLSLTGEMTAFLRVVTQDPTAAARVRHIARRFVQTMDTLQTGAMEWYALEDVCRRWGHVASVALDWCHDDLPLPLRDSLTQALYRLNKTFMDQYILSASGQSYVSSHNALNTIFAHQYCLALYHEPSLSAQQQETLRGWLWNLHDKWRYYFFPCYSYFRDDDGGWNWGAAYSFWSLYDQVQLVDNYLIGTDFNPLEHFPYFEESINQYWYMKRPDDVCLHLGDGEMQVGIDRAILRHAAWYGDPRSQWLVQKYGPTWTYPAYNITAYRDFSLPEIEQPAVPLDWWSDKSGIAVSQTAWDSSAVQMWFYNAPVKKAAHEHFDNNGFGIFYREPVLINSGYYDSYGNGHYQNYYNRTVASNALCVYDPLDTIRWYAAVVANDGGQRFIAPLSSQYEFGNASQSAGFWRTYFADSSFTFISSDATAAYNPVKLRQANRRLLFIKPGRFILLDDVVLNEPDIPNTLKEVRSNLHFTPEPQFAGPPVEAAVPGHVEAFADTLCSVPFSWGALHLNNLLPEGIQMRKIGGEGYEYYVDGVNYPHSTPIAAVATPGDWRLELLPPVQDDTLKLLSTLRIESPEIQEPEPLAGLLNPSTVGVVYPDELYIFPNRPDTIADYLAGWMPATNDGLVFAAGLLPLTEFCVYADSAIVGVMVTNNLGIGIAGGLAIPAGPAFIEVRACVIDGVIANAPARASLTVAPNPAQSLVFFTSVWPTNTKASLELVDAMGRVLVQKSLDSAEGVLDLSHIPPGFYTLLLRSEIGQIAARRLQIIR